MSASDHAHGAPHFTEHSTEHATEHAHGDCGGCTLARAAARRTFLRDAASVAAGLLVTLGARPAEAARAPLRLLSALARVGGELRYPVPASDGVEIDAENDVIVVRHEQALYALYLACPHQRVALRWREAEGRFQCPKHKSKYRPDGTFISGRATRHMDRLPLRVDGGDLVVTTDAPIRVDRDPAGWAAAVVRL